MDMTALQQPNFVAATPRYSCHWHKASDGTLVMSWAPMKAGRPALDIVSDNLNSPRSGAMPNNAPLTNRVKAVAERIAIVLLLGGSAWLTFSIFMVEHSDLL
jgi:hypothetical protein